MVLKTEQGGEISKLMQKKAHVKTENKIYQKKKQKKVAKIDITHPRFLSLPIPEINAINLWL